MTLKTEFERNGGRFFLGDNVMEADFNDDGSVKSIATSNFDDIRVYADDFVLATGSFFSKGLIATPEKVYEPVFGADLKYAEKRDGWFDRNFWNRQDYISFGAKVSETLNAFINGKEISNLYAIGSLLGGANTLYEGCGGGVAIISALKAADIILQK